MNKYVRTTLLSLLFILALLQFVRPARNLSNENTNDISRAFPLPADVQTALRTSCYECHSNYTDYPWYTEIQPVGLWLNDHVNEGKEELNFSEFVAYNLRRQYRKFEEMDEQVREGEMPLSSYTLIHRDAILSPEQQRAIVTWTSAMQDSLRAHYPMDSLVRKR
ncbi:MAG: heme-binding domain-containing protein [Saprospiraceae bacterium]